MQQYELNYIISGDIPETDLENKSKEVVKAIESCGGKVIEENVVGRKSLAFPIKKQTTGVYVQLFFDIDPEKSPKVVSELKSYPFVIRHFLSQTVTPKPKVVLKPKAVIREKVPAAVKLERSFDKAPSIASATGDRQDKESAPKVEKPKVAKKTKPVEDKKKEVKIKKVSAKVIEDKEIKEEKKKPKTEPKAKKAPGEQEIIKDIESEEERLKKLDEKIEELLKE